MTIALGVEASAAAKLKAISSAKQPLETCIPSHDTVDQMSTSADFYSGNLHGYEGPPTVHAFEPFSARVGSGCVYGC